MAVMEPWGVTLHTPLDSAKVGDEAAAVGQVIFPHLPKRVLEIQRGHLHKSTPSLRCRGRRGTHENHKHTHIYTHSRHVKAAYRTTVEAAGTHITGAESPHLIHSGSVGAVV